MSGIGAITVLAAFGLTGFATGLVRRYALAARQLDLPNARSSHSIPTPRGGGLAIVCTCVVVWVVLWKVGLIETRLLLALCGGGLQVAAVGLLDDRKALPAGIRLAVHLAAAVWAVIWLGGLPSLRIGDQIVYLGWVGHSLAVVGIVWTLNLFNFMDGIDGIATSEAAFVALGGAGLTLGGPEAGGLLAADLVLVAACAGFLLWNWPPARIFLGDVGSGYLGYVIVVLAVAATRENPIALWVWLILGGAFFVDATVTLVRRALRNERLYEAHRSHAYQWLARRWGSHGKVTVAVVAVNLLWLLPCAAAAVRLPTYAPASVIIALAPLAVLAIALGSGRKEPSVSGR